ncbi:MAG: hypothetical protein Q8924_20070 [Bacillota bacterium]|jgi:hypothetical protein|nr:hypothetical protein [Bacillota bacterium]
MDSLQKIAGSLQRLLDSNNEEVIVFLVIFLFVYLVKPGERDANDAGESENHDTGSIVFLIAFFLVLFFGGVFDDD